MKRLIITGLAAVAVALPLAQVAQAGPAAPAVPDAIAVTGAHKPYLIAHAHGVQIYACEGLGWKLLAPRATLTADNGNVIGSHYGGPTWEARDGSNVVAKRDAGVPGAPGAVDWLRLKATSTAAGADGDRLAGTTYIQRIHTVGGVAPAGACAAGASAEVPYTADYVFFKATGD
jgi:hypothetical protein